LALAARNRFCGKRIRCELLKLGIVVSSRSIRRHSRHRHSRRPSRSWRTFLGNHAQGISSGPTNVALRGLRLVEVPDYNVVDLKELERLAHTDEFEGERFGVGVSFILVAMPPGSGVRLHEHPYAEIFIVQEGQATFTIGSSRVDVNAPRIVIGPPATPHAFINSGDGPLKQVDIHLSPKFITKWLESDARD
jgi:mannose-6-phosphate isomerase-like protein (cupin superfamily)